MRMLAHSAAALAALAAAPLAAGALVARPQWRPGSLERLGHVHTAPGAVWVHGASVGEALAAIPLLDALHDSGRAVVVSTQTLTGRSALRRFRPDQPCQLAPLDHPWAVARWLAAARPAALVLLEAELWPCWIAAAARQGFPVALLSARISDRSFGRYRTVRPFVQRTLRRIDAIGARSERDAERFRALGAVPAAITVSGDLKLDAKPASALPETELRERLAGHPLFVAGSTHPGEERAALQALRSAESAGHGAVLVIAPRRIERADEIERLARAEGRRVLRRSVPAGGPARQGDVLLLDTLGELRSVWALADVAFVGGTLAPVGGHNLLEPVAAGRPVLFGPHTRDVTHAVEILEKCAAGRCVADAAELSRELVALLSDPAAAAAMGRRGSDELVQRRGSSARSLALLERLLADRDRRAA